MDCSKHEVLSDKEAKAIIEMYKATPDEFPKIKSTDAALKGMEDVKVGSIVKITRQSPTAGDAIYYRIVVD